MTIETRFWPKVDKDGPVPAQRPDLGPCWLWTAGTNGYGYGYFNMDARRATHMNAGAHRVAYELLIGPIPEGLTLDHLCLNNPCVNPAHLEPVTLAENIRRSPQAQAKRARTHCPQGHPYNAANTRWRTRPNPGRSCRACDSGSGAGRRRSMVALASRLDIAVTNHRVDLVPEVAVRLQARRADPCRCAVCSGDRFWKFIGLILAAAAFVAIVWGLLVFVFTLRGPA
jgi:hypothetical protein